MHAGQTQSRFQSSAEARIQGQHSTCRSGDNAWHWPDSPAQGDFAFALGMHDSPRLRFHLLSTGQAQWREGFWGERFALCRDGALQAMEEILNTTPHGASLHNFPKAAG